LSSLVGKFLGVESAAILFDRKGGTWAVQASNLVDMGAGGALGINPNATEPLHLDNTGHPAADRIALACIEKSRARTRCRMGRRHRQKQRTVRSVFLAQCLIAFVSRPISSKGRANPRSGSEV